MPNSGGYLIPLLDELKNYFFETNAKYRVASRIFVRGRAQARATKTRPCVCITAAFLAISHKLVYHVASDYIVRCRRFMLSGRCPVGHVRKNQRGSAMAGKRDFTDRFLKAIKPAAPEKRVILYDAQVPGFGIRVSDRSSEGNRGSFVLVARFPGSSNPTARRIGDYPGMSLAKAREVARAWREDLRQNVDPKVKLAEQARLEARRRASTFEAVFEQFADDRLSALRTGAGRQASDNKPCDASMARPPDTRNHARRCQRFD